MAEEADRATKEDLGGGAGSGDEIGSGSEPAVDFDGPDAAAAAKLRNEQPMSLLGKRIIVQDQGSGVVSNFSKSKFFGPST